MSIRPLDVTFEIDVANTSHTAVTIGTKTANNGCSKAAFLNTGTTIVIMATAPVGKSKAVVFPGDGTAATDGYICLPASMTAPIVFSTAQMPCDVVGIGSGAGPSKVFVTPCED